MITVAFIAATCAIVRLIGCYIKRFLYSQEGLLISVLLLVIFAMVLVGNL